MDGSTAALVVIPIVVGLALASWLLLVAHAAAHPRWKHNRSAAGPGNAAGAAGQIRVAAPGPSGLATGGAGDEVPQPPARLAA